MNGDSGSRQSLYSHLLPILAHLGCRVPNFSVPFTRVFTSSPLLVYSTLSLLLPGQLAFASLLQDDFFKLNLFSCIALYHPSYD